MFSGTAAATHFQPASAQTMPSGTTAEVIAQFRNSDSMEVVVRRALSGEIVCDFTKESESKRNIVLLVAPNYKDKPLLTQKIKYYPKFSAFVFCDSPLHYAREQLFAYQMGGTSNQPNLSKNAPLQPDIVRILNLKLEEPSRNLKPEESLALFEECASRGEAVFEQARLENEVVMVVSNVGAGKSTFINYLAGCTMELVSTKPLGIVSLDSKVVAVKSVTKGGKREAVIPIEHSASKTFIPQLYTASSTLTLCECPGFFGDRGFEINAAIALNIKKVFQAPQRVKVIILIKWNTLWADRSRGFRDLLSICSGLFDSAEKFLQYEQSCLLGVTHLPMQQQGEDFFSELQNCLTANKTIPPAIQKVLALLAKRLFIYHPVDKISAAIPGALKSESLVQTISQLSPIQVEKNLFHTSLTVEDKQQIECFAGLLRSKIDALIKHPHLTETQYEELGKIQKNLNRLQVLDHPWVQKLQETIRSTILSRLRKEVHAFNLLSYEDNIESFKQSQTLLNQIWNGVRFFDDATKEEVASLFKDTSLQANTVPQPMHLIREHLVANAVHNARLRDLIFASQMEKQRLEGRLATTLRQFSARAEELASSLQRVTETVKKEVREGKLTGERLEIAYMLCDMKKQALFTITETTQQHIELEKQNIDAYGVQLKGTLEIALYARMAEIDFIQQKLTNLEQQFDHEWLVAIKVHSHKMAHEVQHYSQMLQIKVIRKQAESADFSQQVDNIEVGIQQVHIQEDLRLKQEQIYHKYYMQLCRLQLQGAKDMYRMDIAARLDIAKLFQDIKQQLSKSKP